MVPIIRRLPSVIALLGISQLVAVFVVYEVRILDVHEIATSTSESRYHHDGNQQYNGEYQMVLISSSNEEKQVEARNFGLQNEDIVANFPKADEDVVLNPIHFCRSKRKGNFVIPGKKTGFPILYQCTGPEYKEFGQKLNSFADNITLHGPIWGRRLFPIPANNRVMALGNSHTRQVMHSLIGHTGRRQCREGCCPPGIHSHHISNPIFERRYSLSHHQQSCRIQQQVAPVRGTFDPNAARFFGC
jgi:hypothetical protein